MATVLHDRVKETCTATGTGAITLTGALDATTSEYADRYADGDLVPYAVVESGAGFEIGEGVFTLAGLTIARTAGGVSSSSNADGLVTFTAGNKECFAALTAADIASVLARIKTNSDNITLLHFYRAIDNGHSVQNMVDGFVDEYEDETGVQPGYAALYDAINDYYTNQVLGDDVLVTSSLVSSMAVSAWEPTVRGFWITPDGAKVILVGNGAGPANINEFVLDTPWVAGGFSQTGLISVEANDPEPRGMFFTSDGLNMFITDNAHISSYTLSAAFDIFSTVTYIATLATGTNSREMSLSVAQDKLYIMRAASPPQIEQRTLTVPGNIHGGNTLDGFYDLSGVDTSPQGFTFKDDGTVLFVIGFTDKDVHKIELTTAWDILGTKIISEIFDITADGTQPSSIFLRSSGASMYVLEDAVDTIRQYSLATPWQLNTSRNALLSVDTNTKDVSFKPDGTRVYTYGANSGNLTQYDLATAWDMQSTITAAGTFDINTVQTQLHGFEFSADGLRLFIIGLSPNAVHMYILGVAWDVTSIVNQVKSTFSLSGQGASFQGIRLSPDGLKMYGVDATGDDVNQYSLPGAWSIGLTLTGSQSLPSSMQELVFKPDGTKVYFCNFVTDQVYQYGLSVAWDLTSTFTQDGTQSLASQQTTPKGITISADGLTLLIVGNDDDTLDQYTIGSAWDITAGITHVAVNDLSVTVGTQMESVTFNNDGTKLYITESLNDTIKQFALATAWKIGTFREGTLSGLTNLTAIAFNATGTKLFTSDTVAETITQHSLATPWVVTSGVTSDGTLSVAGQQLHITGMYMKADGTKLFIVGQNVAQITQYTLTVAGDITSGVTVDGSLSITESFNNFYDLEFSSDGTKVYYCEDTTARVYQRTLTTAWDITGTVTANGFLTPSVGSPRGLAFNGDGTVLAIMTNNSNAESVYRFSVTTAWDVTGTVTLQATFKGAGHSNGHGVSYSSDGFTMFIGTTSSVNQYSITATAFQPDSGMTVEHTLGVTVQQSSPKGVAFNSTGTKLAVVGAGHNNVDQYDIVTPWDLTGTVTHEGSAPLQDFITSMLGISYGDSGDKLYALNATTLKELEVPVAGDVLGTPTLDGVTSVSAQTPSPTGLTFSSDGAVLWVTGTSLHQYLLTTPWDVTGTVTFDGTFIIPFFSTPLGAASSGEGDKVYVVESTALHQFKLPTPLVPMLLESVPVVAISQADIATVTLLQESVGAVDPLVDLTVSVSRDNGVTYSTSALVLITSATGGQNVYTAEIDISGQPAGIDMVYKLETTDVGSNLQGASLQWR